MIQALLSRFAVGKIFGGVFGYLNKRGRRQHNLDVAGIESTKDSWKDEFITAVVLFPLILINFATLLAVLHLTWDWAWGVLDTTKIGAPEQMIDAVIYGLEAIGRFPDFYTHLLYITITAGLGLYVLAKGSKMGKNGGGKPPKGDTSADVTGVK